MKIAIFGFGAIGGLIGARLATAGHDVSAIARGATLAALQRHGARVQNGDTVHSVPVRAVQDPAELGVQDLVVLAVKATGMTDVAHRIPPLIGPHTVVLSAMNGVPWWFFANEQLPCAGTRLKSLDPDGALLRAMPAEQVIGCVVHLAASCPEPGLVRADVGNRLIVGEPGGRSARVGEIAALLAKAGFTVETSNDIRTALWYKLWGNITMNPVSALTGASSHPLLDDPLVHAFCLAVMREAAAIGEKIGCPIAQSAEERMAEARRLSSFKTSMLQDVEAGKPLEIDALITSVHEIGKLVGVPTPNIDALLGLTRLFARTRGLYPAG